eukprot:SM000122S25786  [mRNA]  locus=s122:322166:327071:+ [translate_table: standard]
MAKDMELSIADALVSSAARRVMVAVSQDPTRTKALIKWTLGNVATKPADTVVLLHVITKVQCGGLGIVRPVTEVSEKMTEEYIERMVAPFMVKCKQICNICEVPAQILVVSNDSKVRGVLDEVERLGITRLVIGFHASGRVNRMIKRIWGTGASCVHGAPPGCSVWVVDKSDVLLKREVAGEPSDPVVLLASSALAQDSSKALLESPTDAASRSKEEVVRVEDEHTDLIAPPDSPGTPNPVSKETHRVAEAASNGSLAGDDAVRRLSLGEEHSISNGAFSARSGGSEASTSGRDSPRSSSSSRVPKAKSDEDVGAVPAKKWQWSVNVNAKDPNSPRDGARRQPARTTYLAKVAPTRWEYTEPLTAIKVASFFSASSTASWRGFTDQLGQVVTADDLAHLAAVQAEEKRVKKVLELAEERVRQAELAAKKAKEAAVQATRDVETLGARCREAEAAVAEAEDQAKDHKSMVAEAQRMKDEAVAAARLAEELAESESRKREEALAAAKQAKLAADVEEKRRQEAEATLTKLLQRQAYRQYSYEDLEAATNSFSADSCIGEGTFGRVYKGVLHHTKYAIKVLKNPNLQQAQEEFQKEMEMLSRIHHPHMVMLLGCCLGPEHFCIIYDYMENGSVEDRLQCLQGTPPLLWHTRIRVAAEVASALVFLHSSPEHILHRDVKPANIFLDRNFVAKLGDVGLACLMKTAYDSGMSHGYQTWPVGSFGYIAPEFQRSGEFGTFTDIYSLGMVLLRLLTGQDSMVRKVIEAVQKKRIADILDPSAGNWPLKLASKVAEVALACAEIDRTKRPDLATVILPKLAACRDEAELAAQEDARRRPMEDDVIPSSFFCPITRDVMVDPVFASDGHTYERKSIQEWLAAQAKAGVDPPKSPMTNLHLSSKQLTSNHLLRSMICEWEQRRRQHQLDVQAERIAQVDLAVGSWDHTSSSSSSDSLKSV